MTMSVAEKKMDRPATADRSTVVDRGEERRLPVDLGAETEAIHFVFSVNAVRRNVKCVFDT